MMIMSMFIIMVFSIAAQGGEGGEVDDQFRVINKFLTDTEEYLNKLVAKLGKLQAMQDSQEYVQRVMDEARRGGRGVAAVMRSPCIVHMLGVTSPPA
jgi:hypothetical protein